MFWFGGSFVVFYAVVLLLVGCLDCVCFVCYLVVWCCCLLVLRGWFVCMCFTGFACFAGNIVLIHWFYDECYWCCGLDWFDCVVVLCFIWKCLLVVFVCLLFVWLFTSGCCVVWFSFVLDWLVFVHCWSVWFCGLVWLVCLFCCVDCWFVWLCFADVLLLVFAVVFVIACCGLVGSFDLLCLWFGFCNLLVTGGLIVYC